MTFQKLHFLLQDCTRHGSRLWMLMESKRVASDFRILFVSISTALDVFPFEIVNVSLEVKEYVDLIIKQARQGRVEVEPNDEKAMKTVLSVLNQFENSIAPSESDLKRVLDHIGIKRWSECDEEIKFLDAEIGYARVNEEKEKIAFFSSLMGFVCYSRCLVIDVDDDDDDGDNPKRFSDDDTLISGFLNPDDFRCPITLEFMSDPVTIETGHTYDRSSILKWFNGGNSTCPKTGKKLISIELVPNLVIRRLIHRYCSSNSIPISDPCRIKNHDREAITKTVHSGSLAAKSAMKMLASFLTDQLQESETEKNRAAFEIRSLSKSSIFNRCCFVQSGAIRHLLKLLLSKNPTTQENAMVALFYLSQHPKSRSIIAQYYWGLELIVGVLKEGMKIESRHHAATTLYYFCSDENNRKVIGEDPDAITSLIDLIKDGSDDGGKKNALVTIFGLLFHHENHKRFIQGNLIPLLVNILRTCEKEDIMANSLAVLVSLAEKSEGLKEILKNGALDLSVEILNNSYSTSSIGKEKEYCVSLLLSLCINGGPDVVGVLAKNHSLIGSLYNVLSEGPSRASKKASALVNILHDFCETRTTPGFMSTPSSSVLPQQQQQSVHVW